MRGIVRTVAFGGVIFGALACAASAADMPTKAPPVAVATGPSVVFFGGVAVDEAGWFADAGAVAAFNRNLNLPGWLFRIRGGGGHYDYNRSATLEQGVDYQVGEVMLGYQWFMGPSRISVYAGPNVENHDNNDPLAEVAGTKWGFKAQGEIFTNFAPNWYSLVLGTYSTAFSSYFALGKLGYRVTPFISIGPEVAALGNDRFDAVRTGPFVAFDVTPSTQLILSGGYSWDERHDALNDNSGAYGTMHVRTTF
jgi:hypothetical protein